MATIEKCPACETELELEDADYGAMFACPQCGTDVIIEKRRTGPRIARQRPIVVRPAPSQPAPSVSGGNIAAAYILSVIMPLIGFFAGIYLMAKKEAGHGVACMGISALSFLIWVSILNS